MSDLKAARYKEFQKEEKRRSLGQGSAKGGPRYDTVTKNVTKENYDGTASQAYGVADNSAHKILSRVNAKDTKPSTPDANKVRGK